MSGVMRICSLGGVKGVAMVAVGVVKGRKQVVMGCRMGVVGPPVGLPVGLPMGLVGRMGAMWVQVQNH